jgi:hypothetical protein
MAWPVPTLPDINSSFKISHWMTAPNLEVSPFSVSGIWRYSDPCFVYVGVLISLWLFQFAAEPKYFFLDGLKKLEQRSHKCVEFRGGGNMQSIYIFFNLVTCCFLYKAKDLSAPPLVISDCRFGEYIPQIWRNGARSARSTLLYKY